MQFTGDTIDRQKALETIDAALQAVRSLRKAMDEDKSLLADIQSHLLLLEVHELLDMLEAEKDNLDD